MSSKATPSALTAEQWFLSRTFHHSRFEDMEALAEKKRQQGLSVSVCIPALNEAATIGPIVRTLRTELMEGVPLIDELAVMDSASPDGTAEVAEEAGAVVFQDEEILPELEHVGGKGDAMWKSLFVLGGDIILWVDADVRDFHPRFVYGLLGPLLEDPEIGYVKGFYERPLKLGSHKDPFGGGRVTELMARPLLNTLWPELAGFAQPLSGEYGGRREVLANIPFLTGYAVETVMLIDVAARYGLASMAQVDLYRRTHRNRDMRDLSRMAFAILQGALLRLEASGRMELHTELARTLHLFEKADRAYLMEGFEIEVKERPPAASLPQYKRAR